METNQRGLEPSKSETDANVESVYVDQGTKRIRKVRDSVLLMLKKKKKKRNADEIPAGAGFQVELIEDNAKKPGKSTGKRSALKSRKQKLKDNISTSSEEKPKAKGKQKLITFTTAKDIME